MLLNIYNRLPENLKIHQFAFKILKYINLDDVIYRLSVYATSDSTVQGLVFFLSFEHSKYISIVIYNKMEGGR